MLDQQRRQLTRAVAQQARTLGQDAGRRVTDQVTTDVEETLRSAMVDEAAGAALLTGLLTDTFSSTGLEPVDLSRVVAVPGSAAGTATTRPVPTASEHVEEPDPDHERRVAEAAEAVATAQADLEAAVEAADEARTLAASAREEREVARGRARRGQAPPARGREAARDGRRAGGRRDPRPREGGRPPGVGDRGRRAVAAPARPAARAPVTGRVHVSQTGRGRRPRARSPWRTTRLAARHPARVRRRPPASRRPGPTAPPPGRAARGR